MSKPEKPSNKSALAALLDKVSTEAPSKLEKVPAPATAKAPGPCPTCGQPVPEADVDKDGDHDD